MLVLPFRILLEQNASMLLSFEILNHKEYDMPKDEYSHLVGKYEFGQIYQLAVGKGAPPYSFLTILPRERVESKIFLARFDQWLAADSDEDQYSSSVSGTSSGFSSAQALFQFSAHCRKSPPDASDSVSLLFALCIKTCRSIERLTTSSNILLAASM